MAENCCLIREWWWRLELAKQIVDNHNAAVVERGVILAEAGQETEADQLLAVQRLRPAVVKQTTTGGQQNGV